MDAQTPVNEQLRQLPQTDRLLRAASEQTNLARWSLLEAARVVLEEARQLLRAGPAEAISFSLEALVSETRARARALEATSPRRVLNATGVVLHTNLGRAPLSEAAAAAAADAARGYSDLELDLESGERGSRVAAVSESLRILSGAEAAFVVNNNAGALLLAVDTLAAGREVVVSRGELVEIGGSFRVPDIMRSSRARLREIGTTNRTHLEDYRAAIGPDTGMLLKVHRSNFELRGFTAEVELAELSRLGREAGIPVVEDRGSGTFLDLRNHALPEPPVTSGLASGASLVLFSGDKLLGGPQAGIALGRRDVVAALMQNPLARALRCDKLTLAALGATLRTLLEGGAERELPSLRMLLADPAELRERAEALAAALARQGWSGVAVEPSNSAVGGGALPEVPLESSVVRLEPGSSADALARALRRSDPPVVVRIHRGAILIDPRTLAPDEAEPLLAAFAKLVHA